MDADLKALQTISIEEVTLEECVSTGLRLREKSDELRWGFGDLAIIVTKRFGKPALTDFSKGVGVRVDTARRYRSVSIAYDPKVREEFKVLSWSHFRLVANRDDRLKWLETACDAEWSVERLSMAMKEDAQLTGTPADMDIGAGMPVRPEIVPCKGCKKWHFVNEVDRCINNGTCRDD